jgi:hypothetical protein
MGVGVLIIESEGRGEQLASKVEPAGHAAGQLHGVQDVAPDDEKVPALQMVQDDEPFVLLDPAGHTLHVENEDAPIVELEVPAGQSVLFKELKGQ